MNTLQKIYGLTELENEMLFNIISAYDSTDICYQSELNQNQYSVIISLIKKGLIYNSSYYSQECSNYFPSIHVLNNYMAIMSEEYA